MSAPRLHVLSWDQPFVRSAVAWLARDWTGTTPLDLADWLIVTPTRHAGRRLREALAEYASARGQAVFAPRVIMPQGLITEGMPLTGLASRADSLLAWIEVLRGIDLTEFAEVFPIEPPSRNFTWAARLAREFQRLQTNLAENGLRLRDVTGRVGRDFPEALRWSQLATLEERYDAALAKRNLRDPQAAKIAFAAAPSLPSGIRRIAVLGTPDPLPLALTLLERHAERVPVDAVVAGPADEDPSTWFDAWGRPRAKVWATRLLELPDFEQHVHLCADPSAQAQRIVAYARAYGSPEGLLGVGVADSEVLPPLENGLNRAGVHSYNPEGHTRRGESLYHLLSLLAEWSADASFETTAALLRCPDVLAWLQTELDGGCGPGRLLAGLDELNTRHLPATLDAALAHANELAVANVSEWGPVADSLVALGGLRETLAKGAFPGNLRATLTAIFGGRRFDLTQGADARVVESAGVWNETLAEIAAAAERFSWVTPAEAWELALRAFGESLHFDEKPAGALELQGWLELLWEDAPHLVVAGLNDGRVPDAVVGDAFLPEGLREKLGLKTNATRFARDAYLLQALAACRATSGRLDLLLGKTSVEGEPLRPSRLLLRCEDAELPRRVAFLFRSVESAQAGLPWTRAWQLRPRADARLTRLSVTAFRDYLACPFRFYLKHALKMEPVDPHKAELDARDFGNLCHAALEALGKDPVVRESTDAGVLRTFLLARLEEATRRRYGTDLTLPLLIQLESARQRLSKAAEVQAQQRAEGWTILRVEWKFTFTLGDLTVSGKIDRIDRHELTGRVRVLDYKTSDKPVNPLAAHVRAPRRSESLVTLPEFAHFEIEGEPRFWIDLQLPLYLHAVGAEFGHAVMCGYFNLPKASTETGVELWEDYDGTWQAAAERCAAGVAEAVAAGRFWPPVELNAREDDFAPLLHQGAESSIAWKDAAS